MTLLEALDAMRRATERPAAMAFVLQSLRQLGARLAGRFAPDLVDEAIQRVATALLIRFSGRAPPPLPSERAAQAYLLRSLRNAALDALAELRPDVHQSLDETEAPALVAAPAEDPVDLSAAEQRARTLLGAAFAEVSRRRAPRYRAQAEVDYQDLLSLTLEGRPFEEVLARTEGPGLEGAARTAAANRLYKRHERLRGELQDAVDALEDHGAMTREDGEDARSVLRLLLRCQRKSTPGVPGQGSDAGRGSP